MPGARKHGESTSAFAVFFVKLLFVTLLTVLIVAAGLVVLLVALHRASLLSEVLL